MTTTAPTRPGIQQRLRRSPGRRLGAASAALAGGLGVSLLISAVLAGPAAADVPESWESTEVGAGQFLLVLVGLPVLLGVVIVLSVYVPPLLRGERVAPGAPVPEDQWIGGPQRATGELAPPDGDTSEAGGAGARW